MKNIYKLIIVLLLTFMTNNLYSQYSLWTWGSNHNGQLGNDREEDAPTPILINDDGDWDKVYSYYAIKKDGTLWTWGDSNINPINKGHESVIRLFDDSKWKEIYTGNGVTYGIKQDGSLWSWGNSDDGWIITEQTKFSPLPFLIDSTHKWKEIAMTRLFILGIDENGFLYSWGHFISTMGIGDIDKSFRDTIDVITRVGDSNNWKQVTSEAFRYSLGVQEDGSIWFWGADTEGLIDTIDKNYFSPVMLGDYDCIDMKRKPIGTVFINSKGEIYSIGKFNSVTSTKPNKLNSGYNPIKIVDTDDRCFAIQFENFCAFIGFNDGLKFGKNNTDSYYSYFATTQSDILKGYKDIAQIGNGSIFIDSLNNLRAWGNNSSGELGNGRNSYYHKPIQLLPNRTFSDISCGENYSLAIDEYGMMWAWGFNYMNDLNIDKIDDFNKPTLVDYAVDWENVYTFGNSNFATKNDGTLWAWGYNENGQLGVGHNNSVSVPTKIEEYGPWEKIHSTWTHTLAIKEDGTLWVWGTGGKTLGIGVDTITQVYKPTNVNNDTDWTDIGCGNGFSVAVKRDSTYWCWGNNYGGVFGDYESRSYDVPTKENPRWGGRIVQIEASERAVIAINTEGEVHIFAPQMCGSTDTFYDDPSSMYLYSNYKGFNAIITESQGLFVATSAASGGGVGYLKIINAAFRKATEEKGWVKATIGREHILALRGEKITNVQEPRKLVNAEIYPNPSVSKINIDFDTFYDNISLSIYDVYGRLVLEDRSSNTDRITINHNLSHGTYILQCRDENSLIIDQVLVVE